MYNFDDLVNMHEYLFPEMNIRIRINNEEITILNTFINNFWFNINHETILEDTLNLCASILCMQPFYDGNSRISKYLLCCILNSFNYIIDYEDIKNKIIIPLFYSFNEGIIFSDIIRFNNAIKK